MFKQALVLTVLLGSAASLPAEFDIDFHRRYQKLEAERRFEQETYVEARELFRSLAENAPSDAERAMFRARAAIALGRMKGQYEAGLAEAAQLAVPACADYARLTLMASQSDWDGIIREFGDASIGDWPSVKLPARPRGSEEEMKALALLKRAQAFEETGAYRRAEQDLSAAADLVVSRHFRARPGILNVLTDLAALRAGRLDDAAGAFEANRRIATLGSGGARYFRGVLSAAAYLRDQAEYDQAVAMIESMSPRGLKGYWYHAGMLALGRTLAAAGRLEEAVAVFKDVTAHRKLDSGQVASAYQAWAQTLVDAGQTAQALALYHRVLELPELPARHREQAEESIRNLETAGE